MMDYYALPKSFPGKEDIQGNNCFEKVRFLEQKWFEDINNQRFVPYLQLHEFEALVFTSPLEVSKAFPGKQNIHKRLENIKNKFDSPEEINDNPDTNPSNRIVKLIPEYQKVFHGALIVGRIGLDKINNECSHFCDWVDKMEGLRVSILIHAK